MITDKVHPYEPTAPQAAFMAVEAIEAHFEGKCAGGKTEALLMDACQHMDVPGYSALILAPNYHALVRPGGLWDRCLGMWEEDDSIKINRTTKTITFPSGAILWFGHLEKPTDHLRFKGIEVQYIGFDELGEFRENHYRYLFTRLRKPRELPVPLKMRSTSTDIDDCKEALMADCVVVPSSLLDNPYVDQKAMFEVLNKLSPEMRAKFLPKELQ